MACPCFEPGERLPGLNGSLGDLYAGICRAAAPWRPDDRTVAEHCNIGYARGRCPRFPDLESRDAVRFSVARHDGACIRILYSLERDHRPLSHGALEYSDTTGEFVDVSLDVSLERLAAAYIRSYLRRMGSTTAVRLSRAAQAAAPRTSPQ